MKITRTCASLSLAALISVTTSYSQQPTPAPAPTAVPATSAPVIPAADQPSRAEVIKLMDAMHIRSQLESLRKQMSAQMKQMIDQSFHSQANMTPEQKTKLESAYDEGANLYPVSEMMDDMIPIYQNHISRKDVDSIVTFYDSPAGQHLLTESPAMMKDSMGVVMPKVRARMQTYMQKMQKDAAATAPKTETPAPKTGAPVSH